MQLHADISLDELSPALARFPSAQNAFVQRVLARAAVAVKEQAPQATSQMTNATRHAMTGFAAGEIVVGTNYAAIVHEGRRAGRVDLSAIKDWVKVKGLPARAAYPIARHISKKGIKPNPWARDYLESNAFSAVLKRTYQRVLSDAMA